MTPGGRRAGGRGTRRGPAGHARGRARRGAPAARRPAAPAPAGAGSRVQGHIAGRGGHPRARQHPQPPRRRTVFQPVGLGLPPGAGRGGGGAAAPARSPRLSACAASVPDPQIRAGGSPRLRSPFVSFPGLPRGADGGRGAGGSVAPPRAKPTGTNQATFGADPPRARSQGRPPGDGGERGGGSVPAEERRRGGGSAEDAPGGGSARPARPAPGVPSGGGGGGTNAPGPARPGGGYSADGGPPAARRSPGLGRIRTRRPRSALRARPALAASDLPSAPLPRSFPSFFLPSFPSSASASKALQQSSLTTRGTTSARRRGVSSAGGSASLPAGKLRSSRDRPSGRAGVQSPPAGRPRSGLEARVPPGLG